jgi:hypothetical protein
MLSEACSKIFEKSMTFSAGKITNVQAMEVDALYYPVLILLSPLQATIKSLCKRRSQLQKMGHTKLSGILGTHFTTTRLWAHQPAKKWAG